MPWGQGGQGFGASQEETGKVQSTELLWSDIARRSWSNWTLQPISPIHCIYFVGSCPSWCCLFFWFLWTWWFYLNPQHYKGLCCWACWAAPRRAGIAATAVPAAEQHCRPPHPEPQNTTVLNPSGPGLYLVSLSKQNCLRRSRASSQRGYSLSHR